MEDNKILDLYWARSENAVTETASKYGRYCRGISLRIVTNTEDAEECVNDTWLHAWNAIPPSRPTLFQAYLGRITRNLSLDCWKRASAQKRGGSSVELILDELSGVLSDEETVEKTMESKELTRIINSFLGQLPEESRYLFVRRYWYGDSIESLADKTGFSQSKIKTALFRLRQKLKDRLSKEGVAI